jgi:hypothetical protein
VAILGEGETAEVVISHPDHRQTARSLDGRDLSLVVGVPLLPTHNVWLSQITRTLQSLQSISNLYAPVRLLIGNIASKVATLAVLLVERSIFGSSTGGGREFEFRIVPFLHLLQSLFDGHCIDARHVKRRHSALIQKLHSFLANIIQ